MTIIATFRSLIGLWLLLCWSPAWASGRQSKTLSIQTTHQGLQQQPVRWSLKPETDYSVLILNQSQQSICLSLPQHAPPELRLTPGQSFVWNVRFTLIDQFDLSCPSLPLYPSPYLYIEW